MTAQILMNPPMAAAHSSNNHTLGDLDLDTLVALDQLDAQEQPDNQEFFRLLNHLRTANPLQSCDVKEIILDVRLPKCLETTRERALYGALMTIIRAERAQRIAYKQQLFNQSRELQVLRQAVQTIVGKASGAG
jgi:hypothetical protein